MLERAEQLFQCVEMTSLRSSLSLNYPHHLNVP